MAGLGIGKALPDQGNVLWIEEHARVDAGRRHGLEKAGVQTCLVKREGHWGPEVFSNFIAGVAKIISLLQQVRPDRQGSAA